MLVLSRKPGERILVPHSDLAITVVSIKGDRVRLGISAPAHVAVFREDRVLMEDAEAVEVLPQAVEHDDVRREDEKIGRKVRVVLVAFVEVGPGDEEARRSIHMHINYGLFASILSELASTVSRIPKDDIVHRDQLARAAAELHRALVPK